MNLVSIIMPTFESAKYINYSVASVMAQTYTDWELIIVDDCSTDNTAEVVSSWLEQDSRISYIRLETNAGAATARNAGIERAAGKYMAFLDSDDFISEDIFLQDIKETSAETDVIVYIYKKYLHTEHMFDIIK